MNTGGNQEEAMAATAGNSSSSANNDVYSHHSTVKGKRTKRQRLLQAVAPRAVPTSPVSSSGDFSGSTTTEEEEDMANCLMLLAQGHMREADTKLATQIEEESGGCGSGGGGGEKVSSRRSAETATTTNGKVGSYVYECKTCNKCFPSFQALGGHRASHKKPKAPSAAAAAATDDKKQADEDSLQISIASYPKLHILPNSDGGRTTTTTFDNNATVNTCKARVHECSICGSEFSSGQALGGHMRRHRPAATVPEPPQEAPKKERSLLSLDLNLPAPSDDDRGDFPRSPSFAFAGKPPLIFSASALVNCHY